MTADRKLHQDCTKNHIAAIQHHRRFMVSRKFMSLKHHSDPLPTAKRRIIKTSYFHSVCSLDKPLLRQKQLRFYSNFTASFRLQ